MHFRSLFSEIIQIFRRDEASFSLLVHRALLLSLISLHYIIEKHFSIIINISGIDCNILFILLTKGILPILLVAVILIHALRALRLFYVTY